MLNLFSRRHLPPKSNAGAPLQRPIGIAPTVGRPDFDLSDFDEPTPTMPGRYWHASDEHRDDPRERPDPFAHLLRGR